MGRYFGTDGFRGEANKNLTVEHAYKVGRFIGWYYHQMTGKKCKVVIGKDTRRSSFRGRCISASCNDHTICFLCDKNRGF